MKSLLILIMTLLSVPAMSQAQCDHHGEGNEFRVKHQYSCKSQRPPQYGDSDRLITCVYIGKDSGEPLFIIDEHYQNHLGGMFFSATNFTFTDSTLSLIKIERPFMAQFNFKYVVSIENDILSFEEFEKTKGSLFARWESVGGPSLYNCTQDF